MQGIQLLHDVQKKVLGGFMFWLLKCLKQFADFKGRARRKEYWMFTLFNLIFSVLVNIITVFGNIPDLGTIFYLVMLIPSLAVAVRRVHDVGKSGWYLLIPIYNLVLVLTEGEKCENKYGPDPKAIEANLGI
jgi:uncharacterized membrane protein YhaH (DUF805 family)